MSARACAGLHRRELAAHCTRAAEGIPTRLGAIGIAAGVALGGMVAITPVSSSAQEPARATERSDMVASQVESRGISDPAVLEAMRAVPRHRFVPEGLAELAYADRPLPIGLDQTISQPYIVAFMVEAADISPGDRILEIGAGSGYGAAVLAEVAGEEGEVYTVEILPELADRARATLGELGYENVHVHTGNGWMGWSEHAPYDAVVVTAAPGRVPEALEEQLAVGGTMVIPVGDQRQVLRVLRKTPEGLREVASLAVRFVPMVEDPADQ